MPSKEIVDKRNIIWYNIFNLGDRLLGRAYLPKTTKEVNMYCIYAFFNNDIPYYIGKTKNFNKRQQQHLINIPKSNLPKYNKVRKLIKHNIPFKMEIIIDNLTEMESIIYEKTYIKYYKLIGYKLYNLTNGGDGGATTLNHPRKKEIYNMISKKLTGRKSPMKGKFQSDKSKKLISINNAKYWKDKKIPKYITDKIKLKRKYQNMEYLYKSYKLIDPDGKITIINDGTLNKFCKNKNLTRGQLINVAKGRRKHHKEWRMEYVNK